VTGPIPTPPVSSTCRAQRRATEQAAAREAYLQRVLDSIPPLTPAQRATVTALLQPRAAPPDIASAS
jgi:hypothetical protein